MNLGDLERQVMDVFWHAPEDSFTVRDMCASFPDHAYTTIMTVMTRLAKKGFLVETRVSRAHVYRAAAAKEVYVASLLADALDQASDRQAALVQFADRMDESDLSAIAQFLASRKRS